MKDATHIVIGLIVASYPIGRTCCTYRIWNKENNLSVKRETRNKEKKALRRRGVGDISGGMSGMLDEISTTQSYYI